MDPCVNKYGPRWVNNGREFVFVAVQGDPKGYQQECITEATAVACVCAERWRGDEPLLCLTFLVFELLGSSDKCHGCHRLGFNYTRLGLSGMNLIRERVLWLVLARVGSTHALSSEALHWHLNGLGSVQTERINKRGDSERARGRQVSTFQYLHVNVWLRHNWRCFQVPQTWMEVEGIDLRITRDVIPRHYKTVLYVNEEECVGRKCFYSYTQSEQWPFKKTYLWGVWWSLSKASFKIRKYYTQNSENKCLATKTLNLMLMGISRSNLFSKENV